MHDLSDAQRKVLLIGKLKVSRFVKAMSELSQQLKLVFGGKESRADMRRIFEKFAVYFEKSRLQAAG